MTEFENGLPGPLPAGERILWQGGPDWRVLARSAFRTRGVALYFGALVLVAALLGSSTGIMMTAVLGTAGVGLLHLLAWGAARTTIYTLTDRRVVLRVGMAVPKCINLPLAKIASADLALRPDGSGDVALTLIGAPSLGYLALWPHARPLRLARPQPMLRALPAAAGVAALVARTCLAAHPGGRIAAIETPAESTPAFGLVQAA